MLHSSAETFQTSLANLSPRNATILRVTPFQNRVKQILRFLLWYPVEESNPRLVIRSHRSYPSERTGQNFELVSESRFELLTPRPERGMFPLHYSEMVGEPDHDTGTRVPKTRMLPLHHSPKLLTSLP